MARVARTLPGSLTRFFGFECRLAEGDSDADLLVCVSPYGRERELLATRGAAIGFPEDTWAEPGWEEVCAFAQAWRSEGSCLHRRVLNMWLEFDTEPGSHASPVPSAFFGSVPLGAGGATGGRCQEWIAEVAVPMLTGRPLKKAVGQTLQRCLKALPMCAHIFQTGVMLARNTEAVRVCISGLQPAQVPAYLKTIGWQGRLEEVRSVVETLAQAVDRVDLDLDLGDGVSPAIGLECSYEPKCSPAENPRWSLLLEALQRLGVCAPSKAEALARFSGLQDEQSDEQCWPDQLLNASAFMEARYLSTLKRGVHHVKVTVEPGSVLRAKAYLSVKHLWVPRSLSPR